MCADRDTDDDDDELADLYSDSRCTGGTMYGMLLESIQHYIQQLHGADGWARVLEHAGLKNVAFTTHKRYRDDMMVKLAHSLSQVMRDRDVDAYMEYFGQCFVQYWTHYGYDTIMRASGRHYRDFLHGIDNLHETMRFSYPKMLTPSFYVDKEDCRGCLLHYRSKRVGFTYYVIGQLRQCGRKFYDVDVQIEVLEVNRLAKGIHIVYSLKFDNSVYRPADIEKALYPAVLEFPTLSAKEFFKAFPFSLVFDRHMHIIHVGRTVQELLGGSRLVGVDLTTKFHLRRPRMDFTWDNVICLQKVIFEIQSMNQVRLRHRDGSSETKEFSDRRLLLKGQMRYLPDMQGIAFLGTPLLNNLEELQSMGLYINELNMYDGSRDMVMAGWQHASKLESLIEQQVEKCRKICDNMRQLDAWRQKSESLLYSMLPQQIADRLRNGEDPVSTCEMFHEVTILFSYTLGFHEMCANTPATELVDCINSIFIAFDAVVEKHNVFKVETLGDAVYMVAGGVPERRSNHALSVASVGLELIEKVRQMHFPCTTNSPIQIRLGMHTGSIVAGVVGRRTPQYCLFGDTVNTASRMQTNSEAGRIHISEPCQRCLKGSEFVTVFRGTMPVKGKGQMSTYWLAGKKSDPSIDAICEQLRKSHKPVANSLSNDTFDLRKHHKRSEMCLLESAGMSISDQTVTFSPQLLVNSGQTAEDDDYISFSVKSDSTTSASPPPPPMRSESYLSIQEKLFEHARRCSTGETTIGTRQRRQSASTALQRSPETQAARSKMRSRTKSESTAHQPSPETRTAGSVYSENLTKCSNASHLSDVTQTASEASKNEVGGKRADSLRALSEKERQRRELDNIVDSLPVPQFSGVKRGVGMCPFAGGDMGNDRDSIDGSSEHLNGHSSNTDLVCPVTGVVKEQSKSTRDASKPGSSLLRAVTRSISSHSKDDWWNSVMCANSADASSQEVSSDEDLPPLIHHEHLTYTSPLAGQRTWSVKGTTPTRSEHRVQLTNGIGISPNISAASKDTNIDSHNRSDVKPDISIGANDGHSSESHLNAHKLVEGCQSLCNHAPTHSLLINGSVTKLCQRTRSNTISTAYKHAASTSGGCDCLLQRRHSASGELSKACDGRPEFSELDADLMSFSSVANIHGCCAFDGGVAKRNLLDASLPDLPYY